jgi:hypothetical protein
MGEREIREKYGGKLAKAINRAIRAEVPGGNEALDKLTALAGPAMQSHWKDRSGNDTPEAVEYFRHKRNVVDQMESIVRKTWGVPAARDAKPSRPGGARGAKPSRPGGARGSKPSRPGGARGAKPSRPGGTGGAGGKRGGRGGR